MSSYPVFCPLCDEDIRERDDKAEIVLSDGGNWEVHNWCAKKALDL